VVIGIDSSPSSTVISYLGNNNRYNSLDEVSHVIRNYKGKSLIVEILPNSTFEIHTSDQIPDLKMLAQKAIVYNYENCSEKILSKDHEDYVQKVSGILDSNFCIPTYKTLEEALERYHERMAKETTCKILQHIWYNGAEGPRLVLNNKPESIMRDSLSQALNIILPPNTEVRPEHNTDETKPVDIKVSWFGSKFTALIEIKWLGKSVTKQKDNISTTFTEYTDSRANSGAKQLIDYISREKQSSPSYLPQGYLVIFDARRKAISDKDTLVSLQDALHYEDKDIIYNPDYSKTHDYFKKPLRFFLRPRESHYQ